MVRYGKAFNRQARFLWQIKQVLSSVRSMRVHHHRAFTRDGRCSNFVLPTSACCLPCLPWVFRLGPKSKEHVIPIVFLSWGPIAKCEWPLRKLRTTDTTW